MTSIVVITCSILDLIFNINRIWSIKEIDQNRTGLEITLGIIFRAFNLTMQIYIFLTVRSLSRAMEAGKLPLPELPTENEVGLSVIITTPTKEKEDSMKDNSLGAQSKYWNIENSFLLKSFKLLHLKSFQSFYLSNLVTFKFHICWNQHCIKQSNKILSTNLWK